jgi:curli production assembly/transport component CsgF
MKSEAEAKSTMRQYLALILNLLCCAPALASELVYTPVNPAFGGSPFNGATLLGSAQATNKHEDPRASNSRFGVNQTPLQLFNENLERSILSQLASAASSGIIAGGKIVPGTVQTGNFNITISELGGGLLQITTTDKVTGAETSFQVNSK